MDESVGTDDTDTVVSDTPNVNRKGFQTTWGPKGYSRKDHCLHLLVDIFCNIFNIFIHLLIRLNLEVLIY